MTGIEGGLVLVAALACIAVTGALGSACLRPRTAVGFLLGAYTVGWAQLIAVTLALSPLALVTRRWLAAGLVATLVAVSVVWRSCGRPRPPALRPALRSVRTALDDPLLAVLAAVVGSCGLYIAALGLFTPSLEWDSLAYHLARAAFWRQEHAVAYIPNASDPRLDGNPPGAEIGFLATMVLSGGDRFVALPQLAALPALVLGIVGIGRRIGLTLRQALFGALVFAALPLVAIQAPTTYNDLVVASFLVICGYAILGFDRSDLPLLALAFGLALTTKLTAVLAVPVLALIAICGSSRRRLSPLAAAAIGGLLLGAPWYLVNLAETGAADGGLAAKTGQSQDLSLIAIAPSIRRYLYGFVDFSGSRDVGVFTLYGALAAGVVVGALAIGALRARVRSTLGLGVGAALVVVLPLVLVELGRGLLHAWFKLWLVLGRGDIARTDGSWQLQTGSDAALSWYGPVGAVLLVVGTVVVALGVARRRLPVVAAALGSAPFVFLVVFAFLVPWDPWRGRFLVFAVAFAAAAWGTVLDRRAVAWGVVALTAVATPLALLSLYTKPSSLPVLHGHAGPSIWTASRGEILAELAQSDDVVHAAAAVNGRAPAVVALAARENDFIYPFFGPRGQNTVRLVPIDGGRVPSDATWLVAPPGTNIVRCGRWARVVTPGEWAVERRTGTTDVPCARLARPGDENEQDLRRPGQNGAS